MQLEPPAILRRTGKAGWFTLVCFSCLAALLPAVASAQDSGSSEYQIKAAFLFNFTRYVDWPSSAFSNDGSPFVIAVVGRDPFDGDLEKTVSGKSVNGRSIMVKRFKQPEDVQACQILFVGRSVVDKMSKITAQAGKATLLVSDTDRFLQRGGMINFVIKDEKIRFEINADAAEHAGLKISSRLLSLATTVRNS